MAIVVSKMSFRDWIGGLATMAWVPEDREVETFPIDKLEIGWGKTSNIWWAPLKIRV
jgi:hypothetical protein